MEEIAALSDSNSTQATDRSIKKNLIENSRRVGCFHLPFISFISNQLLKSEDTNRLERLFVKMDSDMDGRLSKDEFCRAMEDTVDSLDNKESLEQVFKRIDADGSGFIEYCEFVAAGLERQVQLSN